MNMFKPRIFVAANSQVTRRNKNLPEFGLQQAGPQSVMQSPAKNPGGSLPAAKSAVL
jgi:hypothetical protein